MSLDDAAEYAWHKGVPLVGSIWTGNCGHICVVHSVTADHVHYHYRDSDNYRILSHADFLLTFRQQTPGGAVDPWWKDILDSV